MCITVVIKYVILTIVVNALVFSKLYYCCNVWRNSSENNCTEILMCKKFYKQMHHGCSLWETPILVEHTLYIHVKDFINLLLKIVMLCLVSLGLLTT